MQTKVCSICNLSSPIDNFHFRKDTNKHRNNCKLCHARKHKDWLKEHPNYQSAYDKAYYEKNYDRINERNMKYAKNNSENILNYNKDYYKINSESIKQRVRNWIKENPGYSNTYKKNRKRNDSIYKLTCNLRIRMNDAFRNIFNVNKNKRTFEIIGISAEQTKVHMESQFKQGMNWDNYGKGGWDIDHIIPLSSAKTKEELYKLCHYTNLQPLWHMDNIRKGNKMPEMLKALNKSK